MSNEIKSSLHQAARDWAAAGFYVFPCKVGRKEPAVIDWENAATIDIEQIDAWWFINPDYNVACAPGRSGSIVLDVDPPLGDATLQGLIMAHGDLPDTFAVRTPRAGRHLWFDGEGATSVSKLGPKIDTRGIGGYVLIPPSVIAPGEYKNNLTGGSYETLVDTDIAPCPDWIGTALSAQTTRQSAPDVADDLAGNIQRAVTFLQNATPVTEGAGGDARTYEIACTLRDFRLSEQTVFDLMCEHYKIEPKDDRFEAFLERKIANAFEYGQNEAGAWAIQPAAEAFANFISNGPRQDIQPDGPALARSRFYPLTLAEAQVVKEPSWLIPNLLPARGLGVMFGKRKSFKSFLALDLALGISNGVETFSHVPSPAQVVYTVGEGQWNVGHKHAPAWLLGRQQTAADNFYIVPAVPKTIMPETTDEFIKQIEDRGLKPALVIIDTMVRAFGGLDENSARDVGLFLEQCDTIRERLNCAVVTLRHSGKDVTKGARGIALLEDAGDTVWEVIRHEKSNAVEMWVRDQRSAPEREKPWLFEGRTVGPSLVFFPIAEADYAALVQSEQVTSKKHVIAALIRLGARGKENAISVAVLAVDLAAHHHDADPKTVEKMLKKEGRKAPLNAYCENDLWFIVA